MNNVEEMIAQIKTIASSVTEDTYHAGIKQGYMLLVKLHDLGLEKESVYHPLFQYFNSLEDSFSRDYIADILDYVVGWCSPQYHIWKD